VTLGILEEAGFSNRGGRVYVAPDVVTLASV